MTMVPHTQSAMVLSHGRDVVDGWAEQVAGVAKLADYIARTEFVPGAYRGQPAAVAAAILAGRELGIGPMTALQHLHVIDGRPAMTAQLMRALVLAAGHTFSVDESTSTRCTITGRRADGSTMTVVWTMDDARRAGLTGRKNWTTYPRPMLFARATGELCRALFPDVIGGMAYTLEEAGEIDAAPSAPEPTTTRPVARGRRAAATKRTQIGPMVKPMTPPPADVQTEAPPPGPVETESTGEDDTATVVVDDGNPPATGHPSPVAGGPDLELLTPGQRGQIHAVMRAWGRYEPRSLRLRTLSGLAGRKLTSSSQLSRLEAAAILDLTTHLERTTDPVPQLDALVRAGWERIAADAAPELPMEEPPA